MTRRSQRQRRDAARIRKLEETVAQLDEHGLATNQQRSVRVSRMLLDSSLADSYVGRSHGGDRDYYAVLGYPKSLEFGDFFARYEREHIASRIVDFPADETWRDIPEILDGTDKEGIEDTPFTDALNQLAKRLRLYHYCQRADKMAGIGRYGVLLIGIAGNIPLDQPVGALSSPEDIIYLRPYSEFSASIAQMVNDPNDPRYGLPEIYNLSIAGDLTGEGQRTQRVHWTRVVHIAEGLLENEVFGRPRLQRVFNLLDDMMKLVGGAAEATWKLMRKGFVLDLDPEANLNAADLASLEEQIDEYDHGLRRFMKTRGMNVMDLGSEVVDPSGPFGLIVDLIAGATGIPQRILLGSERGELASSQDASSWAGRIADRRFNWAEPVILRAVIDRLIEWGALPTPTRTEYTVKWKPLFELSETEKATLAETWARGTQIMSQLSGVQAITLSEWRGEFTPFSADLATLEPIHVQQAPQQEGDPNRPDRPDDERSDEDTPNDTTDTADRADVTANSGLSPVEMRALLEAAARVVQYA